MPGDHYLPATYLAIFSHDTNERRRERSLCAVNKVSGEIFATNAGAICWSNDFYLVGGPWPSDSIDKCMSGYEPVLHIALEEMIAGHLDAVTWISTLVPFVVALLVRGPDFNRRFEERLELILPGVTMITGPDNTNYSRIMEQQRLRMAIVGARWVVCETSGRFTQITNDLGYIPLLEDQTRRVGIAIPIGPRHILNIIPVVKRFVAVARDRKWWPIIEARTITDSSHKHFLRLAAQHAQRFVIGPDEQTMCQYRIKDQAPLRTLEPAELGFLHGALARKWEMGYFSILQRLSGAVPEDGTILNLDLLGPR